MGRINFPKREKNRGPGREAWGHGLPPHEARRRPRWTEYRTDQETALERVRRAQRIAETDARGRGLERCPWQYAGKSTAPPALVKLGEWRRTGPPEKVDGSHVVLSEELWLPAWLAQAATTLGGGTFTQLLPRGVEAIRAELAARALLAEP